MSENREILNEAEVDFLLAGAAEDVAEPLTSLDDGDATVTMHGDLDQISLADIFQTLAMSKMEGVLRVRNPLEERQVYCRDGYVRIMVPPRLKLRRLGQRLIQAGLLEPDQLRLALLEQKKHKLPLGQLLVREGLIEQESLDEIIGMQIAEDLFALFTWQHGTFEFFKSDPGNDTLGHQFESCPEYEVNSLLLEVARRSDEWELILAAIGSLDEIGCIVADPANPEDLEETHRAVLAGVDGSKTYRQVADQTTFGLFEIARAARDLIDGNILKTIEDHELVAVANDLVEEGESKRAIVLLQTLRDRKGDRSLAIIRGMAQVLEQIGEKRFASMLLLEAAQRSPDALEALELARSARDLAPHDPGTLSFMRTVLVAHDSPESPELEKVTIELLDALIDGDLVSTALEIIDDARRTNSLSSSVMMREARARQKTRDIDGATAVLFELAARYEADNNRQKAIESYEALLRIDRSRKDVQRLLANLRRTRFGTIVRMSATLLIAMLVGGMAVVWWDQKTLDEAIAQANAEVGGLLEQGARDNAREQLKIWRTKLGDCEAIEDLANRVAFAESAEVNRLAHERRTRINEQLLAAARALGQGRLREAMRLYSQTYADVATDADVREEVRGTAANRIAALLDDLSHTAKSLKDRLPEEPGEVLDRQKLSGHLEQLQVICPPMLLLAFEELESSIAAGDLPDFIDPSLRERCTTVLAESRANLLLARDRVAAYTAAVEHHETQRRLDPTFKAAVAKEAEFDFSAALELYRELEGQPAGDTELRRHFRDRVTRNATIVRLLDELARATAGGDFGTAQQHLRALRLSFPEVPFDQLVRLPLTLTSEPAGALVICNGEEVGKTPMLLARKPADETQVSVSLPGFRGAETTLTGDASATWTGRLELVADSQWQHDSAIEIPPVATADGGLVFVDRGGNIVRTPNTLDSVSWQFRSKDLSGWLTDPLVDGRHLIVASLDGDLRALQIADGKLAWHLPDLPCEVMPVQVGRTVALATTDGRLHAIDLEEKRRKSIDLPQPAHGELLAFEQRVIAVGERGLITCRTMPGLQPVWQLQVENIASPAAAISGSRLVVADDQGHVVGIDLRNGDIAWQHDLGTATIGQLTCSGDTVWLTTPERILRLHSQTGEQLPSFAKADSDWMGSPTIVGPRLLVPLRSQQVQVLDAQTGVPLYRLAGGKRCRVLVVGERVLIIGADHLVRNYNALR